MNREHDFFNLATVVSRLNRDKVGVGRNINLEVQPTLPQNTPDYGSESLKALELRKEREDKALYENLVDEENSLAQNHNHR